MTRLTLGEGKVTADCANATRVMRGMKKLAARNKGDLSSAVISAGHHARKQNQIMYVYLGNSYGHLVWNVASKASDYLSPINNIGRTVLSVAPDLACLEYAVLRDGQPAPEEETEMHENAKTRLDQILDQVEDGKREVTIDAEGYSPEQVTQIIAAAKSRGLHVSGTRRWLLIRDLRAMHENAKLPKGIREVRGESSQARKGQIADVPRSREYEDADWPWIRKNAKGTLYIEVRPSKGNDWVEALDGTYDAGSIREARKYAFGLLQSGEADAVTVKGWGPRWSSRGGTDQAILYEFGEYELGSAYDVETVNRIDVLIKSLGESDHQREVELMSGVQESRYFQGTMRAVTESDLRDVLYRLQAQRRVAEERGHEPNMARFSKYNQPFKCAGCGRMTAPGSRGDPGSELCLKCFEEAGLENEHQDEGHPEKVKGCPLCERHEPNAGSYYVWVIGSNNQPLDEGPFGPHDLEGAKTFARISATEGGHDRAVSRGLDPKASSFEIVRRYRAGSGERVL